MTEEVTAPYRPVLVRFLYEHINEDRAAYRRHLDTGNYLARIEHLGRLRAFHQVRTLCGIPFPAEGVLELGSEKL